MGTCNYRTMIVVVVCLVGLGSSLKDPMMDEGSDCFVKWVRGYRLASGRPQKILHSVSLEVCKQECGSSVGCAAFAFGSTHPQENSTSTLTTQSTICELAINNRFRHSTSSPSSSRYSPQQRSYDNPLRFFRDGRSTDKSNSTTDGAPTITIQDLDRNPTYDVYIENPNANDPCFKREPVYESGYPPVGNQIVGGSVSSSNSGFGGVGVGSSFNGVPIDCFYRLISGKRLVKTHTLRAISVNSLQECQEACIHERSFNCRSISYRYMPSSGYSYPVSNCEMSSYYMQSGSLSSSYSKLDFVEDYDYDYFQRESHCKTTSSSTLGVCAVVVRRGGRVSTTLIKSSHHTITSSQCEHLCATSLFRCRAFAFRHTTRGHDPYHHHNTNSYPSSATPTRDLPPPSDHTCLLYDTDLMRLPSYNIEPDQDYDLFEMGRLMGAECVLYEQFLNRRPGYYSPGPVTSTVASYPVENREFGSYYNGGMMMDRDRYYGGGVGHHDSRNQNHGNNKNSLGSTSDQHPHGTGMNYLIRGEEGKNGGVERVHDLPPSTLEGGGSGFESSRFGNSSSSSGSVVSGSTPFYDKMKDSCLRVYRQDAYLIPEVSRATFPVKSVDECRIECMRSMEVLRFPCRAMAFRHMSDGRTPGVSGSCQLSDNEPREPDLVISRDRYDNAVTFLYDEREVGCGRRYGGGSGGVEQRGRYPGYVDYYNQNRNTYYPNYHNQGSQQQRNYYNDRYDTRGTANRYYEGDNNNNRRYYSNNAHAPSNYNAHYWDYHNRYGGDSRGKYYGSGSSSNMYSEYPSGQGGTTVNGEKCVRGCRVNRDAGFYYCQTDEQGAWDFCCRPDHFCGYSKGLSVPWCYVGTGPSQNIWRSCEAKGSRNNPFFVNPNVAYLHESSPPTVFSLSSSQVANLTKDSAIRLFSNDSSVVEDVGMEESGSGGNNNKGSSREVIVRVSNSTSGDSGKGGKSKV